MTTKMLRIILPAIALFLLNHCYAQTPAKNCSKNDSSQWIATTTGCMHFYAFKNDSLSGRPDLIIVLHGDAPFNNPGYQYLMAKKIARQNKNAVSAGILRPGYTDPDGNTSGGKKGLTTGDNYTRENIDAIAEAIEHLKNVYHPKVTVLVGHSGGAAITADIIALKPRLVDKAVIVSCPCDLVRWRNHMSRQQPGFPQWKAPVSSISPIDVVDHVDKHTEVVVITGQKDTVAPTVLSVDYYNRIKKRVIRSKLVQVPGEGHEILLNDAVLHAIYELLSDTADPNA